LAGDVYVGAGYSLTSHSDSSLEVAIDTKANIDTDTDGAVIFAGYRFFNGNIALEVDYQDHGKVKGELTQAGVVIEDKYWISFQSYNLSIIGIIPYWHHEALKGTARFGVGRTKIDDGGTKYQDGNESTAISLGFGLEYHFVNRLFLRLNLVGHAAYLDYTYDPGPGSSGAELSTGYYHTYSETSLSIGYLF